MNKNYFYKYKLPSDTIDARRIFVLAERNIYVSVNYKSGRPVKMSQFVFPSPLSKELEGLYDKLYEKN